MICLLGICLNFLLPKLAKLGISLKPMSLNNENYGKTRVFGYLRELPWKRLCGWNSPGYILFEFPSDNYRLHVPGISAKHGTKAWHFKFQCDFQNLIYKNHDFVFVHEYANEVICKLFVVCIELHIFLWIWNVIRVSTTCTTKSRQVIVKSMEKHQHLSFEGVAMETTLWVHTLPLPSSTSILTMMHIIHANRWHNKKVLHFGLRFDLWSTFQASD